jgi:hypothetical protein
VESKFLRFGKNLCVLTRDPLESSAAIAGGAQAGTTSSVAVAAYTLR